MPDSSFDFIFFPNKKVIDCTKAVHVPKYLLRSSYFITKKH